MWPVGGELSPEDLGSRRRPMRVPRSFRPGRAVNLVGVGSANYAQVEREITGAVFRHLPARRIRSTVRTYDPSALNFTLFAREHADVLMSHGLADKRYFWMRDPETGERYINRFEHVLVPGEWLRHKLLASRKIRLRSEQIHVVGWPRLDTLLARHTTATPAVRAGRRPRVLWAPTHDHRKRDGRSTSSYPDFERHLPRLAEVADVEVSVHPRNRADKRPTQELLLWADYVVSDFGTMVYEAWALGTPVIFPRWILEDRVIEYLPHSAEAYIFSHDIGLHPRSMDELVEQVVTGAPIDGAVTEFLADYLDPSSYGESGRRAAAVLETLRRQPMVPAGLREGGLAEPATLEPAPEVTSAVR